MSHLSALLILALAGLIGGVVLMVVAKGDIALMGAGAGVMSALAYPAGKKIIETNRANAERAKEAERKADDALNTTQMLRMELHDRETKKKKP